MVQLWSCLLLVLATLCVVHTKPYPEEKHRALLRTGYIYFEGFGYYRSVRIILSDNCFMALSAATSLCVCVCVCVADRSMGYIDAMNGPTVNDNRQVPNKIVSKITVRQCN
jgi:hypothetical protein